MTKGKYNLRTNFLSGSVAIGLAASVSMLAISPAMAQQAIAINIPAQSAPEAITRLARQTGTQILFDHAQLRRVRTRPVNATVSPQEAVRIMLEGSGFEVVPTPSGALVIRPIAVAAQTRGEETASPGSGEAEAGGAAADSESAGPGEGAADSSVITVVGTRLRVRGDTANPVTVFERADLDRLGVDNVVDVLDYLPQQSFSLEETRNFAGGQFAQLRGLPASATLLLIDGRRTVTPGLQAATNGFDLGIMPLAVVDRIEVLSSSASAVYGADAVGGVINLVTRRNIVRPEVEAYYATPADGGAQKRLSFTTGLTSGRFQASLALDYSHRDFLLGADRNRLADQDYRRFGSVDRRSQNSRPATICTTNGANLPGLNASCAVVPATSTGTGLTPASFAATAGQTNRESLASFTSIVPQAERFGAVLTAQYSLSDHVTLFGDLLYVHRESAIFGQPSLITATVPASNPFNPFGVPVSARYLFEDIGPTRSELETDFARAVVGLRGDLGRWDWEVAGLWTRDDSTNVTLINSVNATLARSTLNALDPAQSLNLFVGAVPSGSPTLLASVLDTPLVNPFTSTARQASALLRGPLLALPGGEVQVVFGGEVRSENLDFRGTASTVASDRLTWALYAEMRVPLVASAMNVPMIDSLVVTLAGRHDDYDDFGSSSNPQFGLEWRPVAPLLVRATYGTSFRAPSLFELNRPQTIQLNTIFPDLGRNFEEVPITSIFGGNPGLDAERSTSWTAGLVLTPANLPRIELTYWSISQSKRIAVNLDPRLAFANEALFPDRIRRAPRTPADIAAGLPGVLTYWDSSSINLGLLEMRGVDFALSHQLATGIGTLNASLLGTWVDRFEEAPLPGAASTNRVGLGNSIGSVPEWRLTGTVGLRSGPFGIATTVRWQSSYADANALNVANGKRIPARALVDLQASLDLGRIAAPTNSLIARTRLRAGVTNLFDKAPAFSELSNFGYDTSQGDLRGRTFYVGLSKAF